MIDKKKRKHVKEVKHIFLGLNKELIKSGFSTKQLRDSCLKPRPIFKSTTLLVLFLILSLSAVIYEYGLFHIIFTYILGVRCIIPNNYFVWEATRPLSNCEFCINVTEPIVLNNVSREGFAPFAYSSKPIVVKKAFLHWPALNLFDFYFFKKLYSSISDSYKSVDEECQFLHFKSNFISIRDVFEMSEARIHNLPGEKSWYVGW